MNPLFTAAEKVLNTACHGDNERCSTFGRLIGLLSLSLCRPATALGIFRTGEGAGSGRRGSLSADTCIESITGIIWALPEADSLGL